MCYAIYHVLYSGYSVVFFQAEDGIRGAQESRGLGDVYKRRGGDEPGKAKRGRKGGSGPGELEMRATR